MEIGVSWTSIVHQELMMKQVGVEHPYDCVVSKNDHFFFFMCWLTRKMNRIEENATIIFFTYVLCLFYLFPGCLKIKTQTIIIKNLKMDFANNI